MNPRGRETHRSAPGRPRGDSRRGFTLIELLVATAVLVVLVTTTTSIFRESDTVLTVLTGRMESDRAGRAALSMITHDLECAVVDSNLTWTFRLDRYTNTSYGHANYEICVVSLQEEATNGTRAARAIQYWVQETNSLAGHHQYELVRGCSAITITNAADTGAAGNWYWNANWHQDPPTGAGRPTARGMVAENVAAFRVIPGPSGGSSTGLPEYVDILLEVIPERTARQVADLVARGQGNGTHLVEENAKRYASRVFFRNRHGYEER